VWINCFLVVLVGQKQIEGRKIMMKQKELSLFVILLLAAVMTAPAAGQEYIIIGWSDLGMAEVTADFQNLAIHPPANNLRAQVMRKGTDTALPVLLTTGYHVTYEIPGNTYSVGKTNFWSYALSLFGIKPADNTGLSGAGLAGNLISAGTYFYVNGIPLTPYQDSDLSGKDFYQLAMLKVVDENNQLLAATQPVIPVTNITKCVSSGCHSSEDDILARHEEEDGFDRNNKPILCTSCHASNLVGTSGQPGLNSFSQVIHSAHRGRTNDCLRCHGGSETGFLRGAMAAAGFNCQDCHGNIAQIANSIRDGRRPWLDEPSCASDGCHGQEYAEEPGKLFKDSKGHGGMFCSVCHGAPHAVYPSRNDRDNAQIIALQGNQGTLTDCLVCHGSYIPGAGPHGFLPNSSEFSNSLHGTRKGIETWYRAENQGFESVTGIPITSLGCMNCHPDLKADGTPVDEATYQPGCDDCHDFDQGVAVAEESCLACHLRQKEEIDLSNNPLFADHFTDVHRQAGMVCTDCHSGQEIHPDNTIYTSMSEAGALSASCENEDCHPAGQLIPGNEIHDTHLGLLDCSACHVKTVMTCNSCHFETKVQANMDRYYGESPQHEFILLVNSEKKGKVTTATYQSMTYADSSFYTIAPAHGHTVSRQARICWDCHDNQNIYNYHQTGQIILTSWNENEGVLRHNKSVIPVPPDWQEAFQIDFVTYKGEVSDPLDVPFDPENWQFLKHGADQSQMLFAQPLTDKQMNSLAYIFDGLREDGPLHPAGYQLNRNFPNPFNPVTTISYRLPVPCEVTLTVFNSLGQCIARLVQEKQEAGYHHTVWNADTFASGVYYYRLSTDKGFVQTRKLVLLK